MYKSRIFFSLSALTSLHFLHNLFAPQPAVVSLGVFALVGLVALAGVLKAVESLPIIPDVLELIGIAYSLWFTYRYLLFKPDRYIPYSDESAIST